jgi:hypothetical protein
VSSLALQDEIRLALTEEAWLKGCAHQLLLDDGQQDWLRQFLAAPALSSTVWLIGRQRGKTFAAVFLALLVGATKKNAVIRYCAKTKDSAVGIVGPAWKALTETMPVSIRPVKGRNEYEWVFPKTGATFVLFGTDAQSFDKGRGPRTDLQLLDECGFYTDLVEVENALFPAVQTTGGKILYLSTPPRSLAHPYVDRARVAKTNPGQYQHGTFWDNPRVDHEAVIREEAKRLGMSRDDFMASTYFKREYLADLVQEESTAGFPGFTDIVAASVTAPFVLPKYFDAYVAGDLGLNTDPHAAVFAVHEWDTDMVRVLDFLSLRSAVNSVGGFAVECKKKETELWGLDRWSGTLLGAKEWVEEFGGLPEYMQAMVREAAPRQPYLRVFDNASGAAKEFSMEHQYGALPAHKFNLQLAVDSLNQALVDGKLWFHPRCKPVVDQLKSAQWNNQRTTWIRTDSHHFDLAQCCVYLWRHVVHSRTKLLPLPPQADVFKMPDDMKPRNEQPAAMRLRHLKGLFR